MSSFFKFQNRSKVNSLTVNDWKDNDKFYHAAYPCKLNTKIFDKIINVIFFTKQCY